MENAMESLISTAQKKILLFANTDWYLYNFRLSLANALRDAGYDVLLLSPDGQYGPKLRALGFRWEVAPMNRRSLNPIREIVFLCWLIRFLKIEKPQYIHSFTIKCAIYGAIAGRISKVPAIINSIAGMGYIFTNDSLKALVIRWPLRVLMSYALNRSSSIVILQNPDDVRIFADGGIVSKSRIRLIKGSGVNFDKFRQKIWDISKEKNLKVLLAARLLRDKGVTEFSQAAQMLRNEGATVEFYLAGTADCGNPAAIDERKVREWEHNGVLHWLGHVDDMPALLQTMDVMVLPSYREGLPKGLIEGGACALALITTDVPGCREVVQIDGVEGLRIPPRDVIALARAIRRLVEDRNLAMELGLAARKKALLEFSDRVVIEKTIAVYEELETSGIA
ncbi:glycosyltransferase family 4 protein [Paraburkholderia tropica]|uniref:glycosyltransferase family 4 protein n=1 Tax=Paraburkholderia tropica TaxID=92647 RepID=UPI002AB02E56|nr:glycosyltransferase family 4 protein [Paraburkholderia tropica]